MSTKLLIYKILVVIQASEEIFKVEQKLGRNGFGTVAIRDDFNVDTITDNGTGDYTVNFDNAMPNNITLSQALRHGLMLLGHLFINRRTNLHHICFTVQYLH